LLPINILKGGLKMGTQQLQKHLVSFLKWTDRNTPTILTTLGVIGLVQTGIMAYKAGPKGKSIAEAKKQDLRDCAPEDKEAKRAVYGELVKEMAPVVAPPVAMGIATGVCIIGSNQVSNRRIAAISAAYSLTETALRDYKEKTIQLLGEKKSQNIREALAKDKVAANPPKEQDSNQVILTGDGDVLCMDSYSGRYFRSNAQKIGSAINRMSRQLQTDMYISLNEFWDEIGIPRTPMGNDLGWNVDDCQRGMLPISLTAVLTPDDQPCLCVDYDIFLRNDFRNLH
jgi:hypothetical protein